MTSRKAILGQFMTTRFPYILQGLSIPPNTKTIVEPFAGNGDLLPFITNRKIIVECYDIDPKRDDVVERDTLLNPPDYSGKFVLTNPPYLARNKSVDKRIFDVYKVNDLYKCFLVELIRNPSDGGIVIIPLNFWSSIRKMDVDLRKKFLTVYHIIQLNIFEEQVFDDTAYAVCAFQFERREDLVNYPILITIYPAKKNIEVLLDESNNYAIGGEVYNIPMNPRYQITRLVRGVEPNTNILVKCLDDNENSMIRMSIVPDDKIFSDNTPNKTARTYATLVITPPISKTKQAMVVKKFNAYLADKREAYHSLFMSNYRESNTIARKRISFDLVYLIAGSFL